MGIHDSSRTRVAPVFGRLQCLDPSGRLWLQGLLELANTRKVPRPRGRRLPPAGGEVVAEGGETSRSAGASSMAPGECGGAT